MTHQTITALVTILHLTRAFTPPKSSRTTTSLSYQTFSPFDSQTNRSREQTKPEWIPMELIEQFAEDSNMSVERFMELYVDGEAYTSCDDEGDGLHECDFFGQYLGPTKWLHLTPSAHASIDPIHFSIWKEVWSHPHSMVDVADRVSKEVLRHYSEFITSDHRSSVDSDDRSDPTTAPLVRVKVIPASFGLEGFEDGIWEATQDLIPRSSVGNNNESKNDASTFTASTKKAITFIAASPDLTDPTLTSRETPKSSSQAEFASESFREFARALKDKLKLFSEMEGVPLDEMVEVKSFHPLWRGEERMPYPCVAVCAEVDGP